MLKLVLPKGSLEDATLRLFEDADLAVTRSSDVDYRASIEDPRVDDVRILRPQEIPRYVASGLFDIGITGRDWPSYTLRIPRSSTSHTPRGRASLTPPPSTRRGCGSGGTRCIWQHPRVARNVAVRWRG